MRIPLLIILIITSTTLAKTSLNLENTFGYTIVNVATAMELPEVIGTEDGLSDWNNFNYKGILQLLFSKNEKVEIGPEIGFQRLYFWEEKETQGSGTAYWYWGTIWTFQAGLALRFNVSDKLFIMTGGTLHVFTNGSGATVGLPLAIGRDIKITAHFAIPLYFRMDVIFGNAVPIAVGGGVGLKFNFGATQ